MDISPPSSPVHGILQARVLEWVATSFSRRSSWPRNQTQVSYTAGRFFTDWAMRETPLQKLWGKPLYKKFYKMGGAFCLSQKVFPQTIFSKVVSTVILATSSFLASACVRSLFSHLQLFATPWTVAHQVPLSMGFSRQEYWSGLPFPSPNDNIGPHKKTCMWLFKVALFLTDKW